RVLSEYLLHVAEQLHLRAIRIESGSRRRPPRCSSEYVEAGSRFLHCTLSGQGLCRKGTCSQAVESTASSGPPLDRISREISSSGGPTISFIVDRTTLVVVL